MLNRSATFLLVLFATSPCVIAHDYWLQPERFSLNVGQSTAVRLFVGDHLSNESERAFQKQKTVRFQRISQMQTEDLKPKGKEGSKPLCTIAPQRGGNHLIVLERDWSHIELPAAKFNSYLQHEGLSDILQERRQAGEDQAVGRERYRRYLKTLLRVNNQTDETYAHKAGHRLEILPLTNPSAADVGDQLTVSVLFDGKPLPRAQVAAYSRGKEGTKAQEVRTGAKGQVQFTLDHSGLWLIRLVHMQRCRDERDFDWESFWAAYSFSVE